MIQRIVIIVFIVFCLAGCSGVTTSTTIAPTEPPTRTDEQIKEYVLDHSPVRVILELPKDDYFFINGYDGLDYTFTFELQDKLIGKQVGILASYYDMVKIDGQMHLIGEYPVNIDITIPDDVDNDIAKDAGNMPTMYICAKITDVKTIRFSLSGSGAVDDDQITVNSTPGAILCGKAVYFSALNTDSVYHDTGE